MNRAMPGSGVRESDHELAPRVSADEAERFEALMRREAGALVCYLERVVNDQVLAEELAQKVFLHVRRVPERWLSDGDVTVTLYRAATVLALGAVRRQETRKEPSEAGCGVDGQQQLLSDKTNEWMTGGQESSRQEQYRDMIVSAIVSLPEKERIAVVLHKYQGIRHRQVAKILRLSDEAVKSLLFRAYTSLLARLQPVMADASCFSPEPRP